jgi:hypothetical protein
MPTSSRSPFLRRPASRLGWWAAGLAGAFMLMLLYNVFVSMVSRSNSASLQISLPNTGMPMVLCGLAGGVVGLVALIKNHERSWLVWLSLLVGGVILFLVLRAILAA